MQDSLKFTGTEVGYFFICQKKLWWFNHGIEMERDNDRVRLGKLVHEISYERRKKEISIDDRIVLDWQADGIIHEVKLTDKMEQAHEFQLLYYIYYLKAKGIENLKGQIDYPKLRQTKEIELNEENTKILENTLEEMQKIVAAEIPPEVEYIKICRSCSYAELCWS